MRISDWSSDVCSSDLAYVGVFVALACVAKRTAVWALAIVFLGERQLGAALSGIAQLSPTWEARAVYVGLADDVPRRLEREGIPTGTAAVVRGGKRVG